MGVWLVVGLSSVQCNDVYECYPVLAYSGVQSCISPKPGG